VCSAPGTCEQKLPEGFWQDDDRGTCAHAGSTFCSRPRLEDSADERAQHAFLQEVGRFGERRVFEELQQEQAEREQAEQGSGLSVHWLNEGHESGAPYDILLADAHTGRAVTYVEVKTTTVLVSVCRACAVCGACFFPLQIWC